MPRFSPLMFDLSPSSGTPIYRQLIEQVKRHIASNHLQSGDQLPSVRALASQLAVNPMTVSKAYSILEIENVVERHRGKGMIVSEQSEHKAELNDRYALIQPAINELLSQAKQLDIELDDLIEYLTKQFIRTTKDL